MATNDAKIDQLLERQAALIESLAAVNKDLSTLLSGGEPQVETLKQLEQMFELCWRERYQATSAPGAKLVWNYGKDRAQWKRLLRSLDVEEIMARIARYFASNDRFYVDARHPFGVFIGSINRWGAERQDTFVLGAPPVDCKHRPRCATAVAHTEKVNADMRVTR